MTDFYSYLIKQTEYSDCDTSWSPRYSSVGIGAGKDIEGAGTLWFHYNRRTREVFRRFIGFSLPQNAEKTDITALAFGENTVLAAAGVNTFAFASAELASVSLFDGKAAPTKDFRLYSSDGETAFFRGFSLTDEARDPDAEVPFGIAVHTVSGRLEEQDGSYKITAENGKIRFAVSIGILTVDMAELTEKARAAAGKTCAEHTAESRPALEKYAAEFDGDYSEREAEMLAGAARTLILNTTSAEGRLSKYLSCFPSRGAYPTHFLWDTYFQNLGYAVFDSASALDFLLQIAANCREDGKFPQFMCSTWGRPQDSQSPLFGWAVMNLLDSIKDDEKLRVLYEALKANNRWWLTARLTPCGLIYSPSGLETGQDDAPRFDLGATIPCDMNAYLLSQLRATAEVAARLGEEKEKNYYTALADDFSRRIYSVLYCRGDGLFYDVSRDGGEFVKVRSNACVLPLWAGVEMPAEERKFILESFLFNKNAMFGEIPFPSVAYDDKHYDSAGWWRGPTWMPTAYLLTETALKYGYKQQALTAAKRLYDVIVRDGEFHELFDSQTGQGLGARQQGWTGGIFIRLSGMLRREGIL